MLESVFSTQILFSFFILSILEIILGIDNIIFIGILANKVPKESRERARKLGILGAVVTRLAVLSSVSWMAHLVDPLFFINETPFSGKSLILFFGGLFLIYKATKEIHEKLEDGGGHHLLDTHTDAASSTRPAGKKVSLSGIILQIMVIDLVFSLDSVITAVGMVQDLSVMIAANMTALLVMYVFGGGIQDFVDKHPTVKMLALSFLIMIGMVLVADGCSFHIPKTYVYVSMFFSVCVEILNLKVRKNHHG